MKARLHPFFMIDLIIPSLAQVSSKIERCASLLVWQCVNISVCKDSMAFITPLREKFSVFSTSVRILDQTGIEL